MSNQGEFSVESAREAAARDEVDAWVADFLSSSGSDNAALAEALTSKPRWWLGPVEVPFNQLNRLAGPPGEPALCPLEDHDLERVEGMEESIEEGWDPPPLIVSFRDGQLVLEDGNHRVEGLRRAGARRSGPARRLQRPSRRRSLTLPQHVGPPHGATPVAVVTPPRCAQPPTVRATP
jgi:hypothetical protein